MNRSFVLGLLIVAAVAMALRVPFLAERPMHTDESVHTIKFQGLWEKGHYKYDPDEYHGPSLYYFTLPIAWLGPAKNFAQTTEAYYRFVPALFGVGIILAFWLVSNGLGRWPTIIAAILTALSPAMSFYSRYYIHEMLLVFFTMLLIGAGWRYSQTPKLGWALLAGASLGLMHATKETFIIVVVALALALALTIAWRHWLEGNAHEIRAHFNWRHILIGLALGLLISIILFTSFFTNPSGPLDSVRTYLPWLRRAGGSSPHIHPWHYYISFLAFNRPGKGPIWTEGIILLLAAAGLIAVFLRKGMANTNPALARFISFYAVIMTVAYSLIPYKTPWCLLGFLHGLVLLAGIGAMAIVRLMPKWQFKVAAALLMAIAAGHLGWQSYRANFVYVADQRNPYIYAHTAPDLLRLAETVERISLAHPLTNQILIKVIAANSDYWPLPWYLRQFTHVGWWSDVPENPAAAVIISSPKFEASLEEKLSDSHIATGFFGLRPSVFLELFVETNLWQSYLKMPRQPD